MHEHPCVRVHVHVRVRVHVHVRVYVHVHVRVCARMHVCVCREGEVRYFSLDAMWQNGPGFPRVIAHYTFQFAWRGRALGARCRR